MLLEIHNPYKPAVIAWFKFTAQALQRIALLVIRDIAVQADSRAATRL